MKKAMSPFVRKKKYHECSIRVVTSNFDSSLRLDGTLPANPVNDRSVANAVTLKSTFCLP